MSIAEVTVGEVGLGGIVVGRTARGHAVGVAELLRAAIEAAVARYVEVGAPVAVEIDEGRRRGGPSGGDARRRGDVPESAVALVMEEDVPAPVGDVEVEIAVAVVIA